MFSTVIYASSAHAGELRRPALGDVAGDADTVVDDSDHTSSSTLTLMARLVAFACRTALLAASRRTASAWLARTVYRQRAAGRVLDRGVRARIARIGR